MTMTVRLDVSVAVIGVTVECRACGDWRVFPTGDDGDAVRAWAAAHHDPWLRQLLSRVNDGPVETHTFRPARRMR